MDCAVEPPYGIERYRVSTVRRISKQDLDLSESIQARGRAAVADPHLRWNLPSIGRVPGQHRCDCAASVTAQLHRIVAQPGRVRVTFVIDDARLDPDAVGERVDWRTASEVELRVGFAQGDEACLHEVFRRSAPLIYTIAYRALGSSTDGEEITQEVFVSAWRARANYQAEKGSLSGCLIGIARHRIVDRQRSRGRDLRLVQAVTTDRCPNST
jgi:hypothetical protein